jgi:hypothetical protein
MSVIIVHGTHDPDGHWWIETSPGSFAEAIDHGLLEAGNQPAVWRVGDVPVRDFKELRPKGSRNWLWMPKDPPFNNREGRFVWSGLDLHGAGRLVGGKQLARYLETVAALAPDEIIHLVAHSHGCNIIKQATQELHTPLKLGRIIFLACPHFVDIQTGAFPYRIDPNVLGHYSEPILNFYTPQDTVQTTIAQLFPDLGMAPGMPAVKWLGFPGTPLVRAYRRDQDPDAASLYAEFPIDYRGGQGTRAHGAVHSHDVGRFIGYWLGQIEDVSARLCWKELGLGDHLT